jgi:AraC-like DNA-binding protein/mannose-6-phosphate isomerase-like protein (cupin superfamily)
MRIKTSMPRSKKPSMKNKIHPKQHWEQHESFRADSRTAPWITPVFSKIDELKILSPFFFGRHLHAGYFEIMAVLRGTYRAWLNGEMLSLKAGEMLIVKPGDWHNDEFRPGSLIYGLHFILKHGFLSEEAARLFRPGALPREQKVRVNRHIFWPILRKIQSENRSPDGFSVQIQDILIAEFFWRMVRAIPGESLCAEIIGLSEERSFQGALRRLFNERIREPLSLSKMAKHLNISKSSLAHKCKTMLGMSPERLFMQEKINRAQSLLRENTLSVKDISRRLGFENPFHFSRVFKRHTGKSPVGFRAGNPAVQ